MLIEHDLVFIKKNIFNVCGLNLFLKHKTNSNNENQSNCSADGCYHCFYRLQIFYLNRIVIRIYLNNEAENIST